MLTQNISFFGINKFFGPTDCSQYCLVEIVKEPKISNLNTRRSQFTGKFEPIRASPMEKNP